MTDLLNYELLRREIQRVHASTNPDEVSDPKDAERRIMHLLPLTSALRAADVELSALAVDLTRFREQLGKAQAPVRRCHRVNFEADSVQWPESVTAEDVLVIEFPPRAVDLQPIGTFKFFELRIQGHLTPEMIDLIAQWKEEQRFDVLHVGFTAECTSDKQAFVTSLQKLPSSTNGLALGLFRPTDHYESLAHLRTLKLSHLLIHNFVAAPDMSDVKPFWQMQPMKHLDITYIVRVFDWLTQEVRPLRPSDYQLEQFKAQIRNESPELVNLRIAFK